MHFTGLSTTVLLQAGAALGALVVVFYILKLKRRPIPVPFATLWQRILRDKEATSLFSQLKRLLSLLLQLALLALMLLSLGDPRPAVNKHEGRHVVVLVDASASMKAIDVEQAPGVDRLPADKRLYQTRLDIGKQKIREVVRGLGATDRMLVAQMDAAVTPLSTMTGEVTELEDALDKVAASDVRAQYAHGLRFAIDSLSGLANPEIIVVSDGALGEPIDGMGQVDIGNIKLSYVPVGGGGRNVAITGFSVRRYPLDKSRYEVLLEVTNTSEEPGEVELELYGDGNLTDIVSLALQPKESLSRFYPNLSGADRTLEARIKLKGNAPDQLPVDDHAFALLPERRRARIQLVTKGNMYLEAALLLDEYLEVVTVDPAKYPAEGAFDATIFDGVAPPVNDDAGHTFYIDPADDKHAPFKLGDTVKSSKRYPLGFDEIDTKHPVVRHLSLGDVNVGKARMLEGQKADKKVGKSFKGTLLLAGRSKGRKFVALGFDVRDSDLVLRIAWPMLVLNVVNYFLDEDTSYISSFRTGEVWSIPASAAGKTAELKLPGGSSRVVPIKDGRAVFLGQQAGFYQLLLDEAGPNGAAPGKKKPAGKDGAGKDGGAQADGAATMFAANLSDPLESAIAPARELQVGKAKAGAVQGFEVGVRRELWVYFLAAVLLATAFEWLTYHRRLTV